MDILLFAEKIEQWSCLGIQRGPRGGDINAPGHDLSQEPYFVETSKSSRIKLIFTVLRPDYLSHYEDGPSYSLRC